jgi:hypothetical protein
MIAEGRHPDGDSTELTPNKALDFLWAKKYLKRSVYSASGVCVKSMRVPP